jgi:hypothetical protein
MNSAVYPSLKPKEYLVKANDFQLFVLYQFNNSFSLSFFNEIKKLKKLNNTFVITGETTDYTYLNNAQLKFKHTR